MAPVSLSTYREINVSEYTAIRQRMDEYADRIIARDKKYHTGGTGMVIRTLTTHGELRHPPMKRGK